MPEPRTAPVSLRRPRRIQITRHRPWRRDNPDAVIVDRRSLFGNRFKVGEIVPVGPNFPGDTVYVRDRAELAGRDLACWCGSNDPCHADVLMAIANRKTRSRDV